MIVKTLQNNNTRIDLEPFIEFNDTNPIQFLEIPFHNVYDGIIGNNILRPLEAEISYRSQMLKLKTGSKIPLYFSNSQTRRGVEILLLIGSRVKKIYVRYFSRRM